MSSLSAIPFKRIDGSDATLGDFAGSVVLIANVASECGLTPQYEGLEKLFEAYRDRGLVVMGFPANNFGGQEPGTDREIDSFCRGTWGVEFPMASRISVTGDDIHPLYRELIRARPEAVQSGESPLRERLAEHGLAPANDTDITWNFEKFLIDRDGLVVERFAPDIPPEDERITKAIESALSR